jgi:guanylate kinase
MLSITRRGLMLVLSSPSGAGKTTLKNMLLEHDKHIHRSISYTTRAPRPLEEHGKDYYFTDESTFIQMHQDGSFLEDAEVFGNYYGTPKEVVYNHLNNGEDVIFDIDWQGHKALKQIAPDDVVSVFILPPTKKELRNRLIKRAQDTMETVELRMQKANSELKHWHEYDYVIVNKDLDDSFSKLKAILRCERLRKHRRMGVYDFVDQMIKDTEY